MDVTYVSRFVGDRQQFPAHAGDVASFGVNPADGLPLGVTYCARMAAGDLPNLITDTRSESRVRDLPATERARIGAYIGVPLRLSDGTFFGTFCCASHDPQPELGARDVRFMEVLAEILVAELDREHEREVLRDRVDQVITRSQLAIALQPVVSLRDGGRLGAEALARFPPAAGNPATLFPAAASVGRSVELESLAAARALQTIDLLGDTEFLAVNMSPAAMPAIAELVRRQPGMPAHRLVFELTEHDAIERYDELRAVLRDLRQADIRVAIDDAGAGYASIYSVVKLEPDVIKIDRALVDGSATDRARQSVIKGLVALARDIDAMVIGEGVEEVADLQVLCELGVDAAQGYLLARPSLDHDAIRNGLGVTDLAALLG